MYEEAILNVIFYIFLWKATGILYFSREGSKGCAFYLELGSVIDYSHSHVACSSLSFDVPLRQSFMTFCLRNQIYA